MSEKPLAPAAPTHRAPWQLPPGVAPGTWEYAASPRIAATYDDELASSEIFELDRQFVVALLHELPRDATIIDLGCGTGRSLVALAGEQRRLIGVDLSYFMLRETQAKALEVGCDVTCVQANMVQLDGFRDQIADCIVCLFSSLGMVRGRDNRRQTLQHVARMLKPNGRFVLHVHNRYAALTDPGGIRRLVSNWIASRVVSELEFGDRTYRYRGLGKMFLHSFSRTELRRDLLESGLEIVSFKPLDRTGGGFLKRHRLFPALRAGGWMVVAKRT